MSTTGTMRAAVMPAPGRIEVGEFPIPRAGEGEALVRMETAAICGSDVHVVFDGWAREDAIGRPGYPGHEGVGQVVESRTAEFAPGDWVLAVPPGWYGGCFAQYQSVQARWLIRLPDGADRQRMVMAQQLGTTVFGMRKFWGDRPPGRVATVLGSGSAGLFYLQQLLQAGFSTVVVSDLEPGRLEVAGRLGARTVLAPAESVVEATMAASDGAGADLVIEAAGYDVTRELAIECARKWGRVGYFGYPQSYGMSPFPLERAYRKALSLEFMIDTSMEEGLVSYREAIDAIHSGRIDVSYSLNERFPLDRTMDALQLARERGHGSVKMRVDLFPDAV